MRTCSALSGLWRIGAAANLGRWRTTQGGAALYPGLSHYAPLGRTIRLRIGIDCTLQAIQDVVGLFGMAFAQWFYAPTGRKGIAQDKVKRRPGIRHATIFASPGRAEQTTR